MQNELQQRSFLPTDIFNVPLDVYVFLIVSPLKKKTPTKTPHPRPLKKKKKDEYKRE